MSLIDFYSSSDEWSNFLERVGLPPLTDETEILNNEDLEDKLREWASFRGQTLSRTGVNLFLSSCLD